MGGLLANFLFFLLTIHTIKYIRDLQLAGVVWPRRVVSRSPLTLKRDDRMALGAGFGSWPFTAVSCTACPVSEALGFTFICPSWHSCA